MENSYGIGVRNRYELFYDEDVDPFEILDQTDYSKKDKSAEKENKGKVKDSATSPKSSNNDNSKKQGNDKVNQSGNKSKSERVKFSDREERNNRRNKQDDDKEKIFGSEKDKDTRENGIAPRIDSANRGNKEASAARGGSTGLRGSRGGRRGGRGGPGGMGDSRGKREFDRQSGMVTSGVKPVDKRDGSGAFNWGSDKDQIEDQQNLDHPVDLDASTDVLEKSTAEENTGDDAGTKEEEEQREMTLDEWKALQKRDKPVFKIRRAGEGENQAQWKKTYVLKKKEEAPPSAVNEGTSEDDDFDEEQSKKKLFIPIEFQFSDTPTRGRGRGRGGRGTPGRGRGMGPRGGGRGRFQGGGHNHRQEAPKMDDERDFPSLG